MHIKLSCQVNFGFPFIFPSSHTTLFHCIRMSHSPGIVIQSTLILLKLVHWIFLFLFSLLPLMFLTHRFSLFHLPYALIYDSVLAGFHPYPFPVTSHQWFFWHLGILSPFIIFTKLCSLCIFFYQFLIWKKFTPLYESWIKYFIIQASCTHYT